MSLLLDALKKAADDKQKASQKDPASPASVEAPETIEEPVLVATDDADNNLEANGEVTEELTLDSIEPEQIEDPAVEEKIQPADDADSEVGSEADAVS